MYGGFSLLLVVLKSTLPGIAQDWLHICFSSKGGLHVCKSLQSCPSLDSSVPPVSSVHGDSPGKNTEVGYHAQGIFPTHL